MPSLRWNRYWNRRYEWPEHGQEWSGQARYCGQPYQEWKATLADRFIRPGIGPTSVALEIAPGHGRWSPYLIGVARRVILVDLNPDCIDHCRKAFAEAEHVRYFVNDGKTLPFISDRTIDFIWSYDSVVHMEKRVIRSYFREFARVLRPGGRAVIHHPGRRHSTLALSFLRFFGPPGRLLFQRISLKADTMGGGDGDRGMVSNEMVRVLANEAGLTVVCQVDSWGDRNQYNCRRFNDTITELIRPSPG